MIEKILTGNNGIERRHFALGPDEIFYLDAESLNHRFEDEAPALGAKALQEALEKAKLLPSQLDALFVCTCTGYLCPGLSSYIAERLGLRQDTLLQDLVGLGCGAAIPTMRAASYFLAAEPMATAAVLAVEVCSAAFYIDNDPGVIVSACLFGDGASASIWTGVPTAGKRSWKANGFRSLHIPENRDLLRFENRSGKLRNRLHRSVPERAAEAVEVLYRQSVAAQPDKPRLIAHSGGRDVIDAISGRLPDNPLTETASVLRAFGNMSSPSVLFAAQHYLDSLNGHPPENLWLTSFGAGFSAHACMLQPL